MKSQLENILSKSLNLLLILHNSDFGDFCLTPGQIKESSQSADELAQKIEAEEMKKQEKKDFDKLLTTTS